MRKLLTIGKLLSEVTMFVCVVVILHFANRCQIKIGCDICKSECHCTALHIDTGNDSQSTNGTRSYDEELQSSSFAELPLVNTKCTEICGDFRGRSCARILPVRIFFSGKRHRSIVGYAMFDDQSNITLGKS